MVPEQKLRSEGSQQGSQYNEQMGQQANKRARHSHEPLTEEGHRAHSPSTAPSGELVSPGTATRESSRLKSKAASALRTKQETQSAQSLQPDTGNAAAKTQSQSNKSRLSQAALAAQRMKRACTIGEAELLALRPTLLKGYASLQDEHSNPDLEAELKTLLYYFRHHTVEPEVLKRLCVVEVVYMLQNHANRFVADLAAQLLLLGPWKVIYDQLRIANPSWFEAYPIHLPQPPAGAGVAASASVVPVAAALQKQSSDLEKLQK